MAAIYMWFETDVQIWTTTLYPIEAVEGIMFTADLSYGDMHSIDEDSFTFNYGFDDAFVTPILLDGPTPEDDYNWEYGFDDAFVDDILLAGPVPEDDYNFSYGFDDAFIEDLLITAYYPDQGIIMSIDLNSSGCSMTDV